MVQYHTLLQSILANGNSREDRTKTGTLSIFGYQMRFDLSKGFPMLTTRKIFWKNVLHETLFFLNGKTNIKDLHEKNVHIWDLWAKENGDLGPVYGAQWTNWNGSGINQIENVVSEIKHNPNSRRLIVSAWNVEQIPDMALPPCHTLFQFYVNKDVLSCQLYQRSGDAFVGIPYNIASYALITHIIAARTGLRVGEFIHTIGDAHIYKNHIDATIELLNRKEYPLPHLFLTLDNLENSHLINYQHHPHINVELSK